MYIQLTTRCNMSCGHCCVSATDKGTDMTMDVFNHIMQLAGSRRITLGGGEPTIAPIFWEAFHSLYGQHFGVITNGKDTEVTHALIQYARVSTNFSLLVSKSKWHGNLDPSLEPLLKGYTTKYLEEPDILPFGRGTRISEHNADHICMCPGAYIDPTGLVWTCGCMTHKVGYIWDLDSPGDLPTNFCGRRNVAYMEN